MDTLGNLLSSITTRIPTPTTSLPPPHAAQAQPLFPNLPLELREQIYSYVIPSYLNSESPSLSPRAGIYPNNEYAILFTNIATRIDAGLYYIRSRKTFDLWSLEARARFDQFLNWFPDNSGYASVRHLEMRRFYEEIPDRSDIPNGDMTLILRCASLRTLRLWYNGGFDRRDMSARNGKHFAVRHWTAQEIFDIFQLQRLFELENLDRVDLKWWFCWDRRSEGALLTEMEFAEKMAEVERLVRVGFEERGRDVEVRICLQ
ncbi:hypothetical protein K458DRAFT_407194 [Lentithecium fluviatile CBS 122367]|uniref:Uncharacterized protein n=1 Tax=Lentithecium fluviatile CBS 122367 TaxID=1168545 RepID=A0A6G1IQA7_9PLEO|nr:hypothetical protein K458DRAFT_407194 [Lentithecium fluviatile CBS 122367]